MKLGNNLTIEEVLLGFQNDIFHLMDEELNLIISDEGDVYQYNKKTGDFRFCYHPALKISIIEVY